MSGMEISELSSRMAAMSYEEKEIAARHIPDEILLAELTKRQDKKQEFISAINSALWRYETE